MAVVENDDEKRSGQEAHGQVWCRSGVGAARRISGDSERDQAKAESAEINVNRYRSTRRRESLVLETSLPSTRKTSPFCP